VESAGDIPRPVGEEVARQVVDLGGGVVLLGQADARLVQFDRGDVGDDPAQLAGQDALAAANIERPLGPGWHGVEDQRVVVEVVVPPLGRRRHDRGSSHTAASGPSAAVPFLPGVGSAVVQVHGLAGAASVAHLVGMAQRSAMIRLVAGPVAPGGFTVVTR
jgi:hypothetical protein